MQGMVMAQRGTTFFLKDESGGVRVEINKSAWPSLGDQVEVLGFPILRNHQPVLEDATCEPRGKAESPVPKLFSTHLLIDQDAEFVSCRGVLRAVATTESEVVLTLHTSEGDFLARLPRSNAGEPPEWIVESEMQLQGICDVNMELSAGLQEGKQADSFQLLLRGPADVVVLSQPPWWSRPRVLRGISVAAGLFVCLLGALLLRARSRVRQEAQRRAFSEAQFTAILTERSRLARDIHDTLAQGFTAISVHLETIRHGLNSSPEIAMYHLEMARQLVQSSLVEARRAIWRMRSQVIENASLAEAVDQLGSRLAEANGLKFLTHVSGRQLRLSPLVENDLLRIAQEAMTNVVRHARAKSLTVTWTYAPGEVALSVSDDGMGFVPTSGAVGSAVTGGFGIAGMRERAALLNASIDFISAPGKGTEMRLLVPVPGPVLELTTVT